MNINKAPAIDEILERRCALRRTDFLFLSQNALLHWIQLIAPDRILSHVGVSHVHTDDWHLVISTKLTLAKKKKKKRKRKRNSRISPPNERNESCPVCVSLRFACVSTSASRKLAFLLKRDRKEITIDTLTARGCTHVAGISSRFLDLLSYAVGTCVCASDRGVTRALFARK